ncbi:MAG: sulfur carrier protein ThiS [Chloroflexota bacterium]|nr:sulfur carrier protein ThiS [Chloroflexota bacterium]
MTTDERIPHAEAGRPQAARIRVTVNGEDRRLAPRTALATFLAEQDVPAQFVAVAVNNEVVRRADHARVFLEDGDVVEIVRMVGGGSGRHPSTRRAPIAARTGLGQSAH